MDLSAAHTSYNYYNMTLVLCLWQQ